MTDVRYEDILGHTLDGGWSSGGRASEVEQHLDFIADIDLAEPDYSFDLLRIYVRRNDGMILWATDSGCSCPSPFESVTVGELKEATTSTPVDTFIRESGWAADGYSSTSEAELRADISAALREAKTRGAR